MPPLGVPLYPCDNYYMKIYNKTKLKTNFNIILLVKSQIKIIIDFQIIT